MSALTVGMLLTVIRGLRQRRLRPNRPMAAKVPATVEMTVARMDTRRVMYTLSMMSRFWNSLPYQSREKPRHTTLESPALKEKMMSRRMGA